MEAKLTFEARRIRYLFLVTLAALAIFFATVSAWSEETLTLRKEHYRPRLQALRTSRNACSRKYALSTVNLHLNQSTISLRGGGTGRKDEESSGNEELEEEETDQYGSQEYRDLDKRSLGTEDEDLDEDEDGESEDEDMDDDGAAGDGNETSHPTTAQIIQVLPTVSKKARHVLEDIVPRWRETIVPGGVIPPQQDGQVGMSLESVWNGDEQVGLRVCEVFEDARPEATGGIAMGDWLVSIQGVQCSSLSVAGVGNLLAEVDPETKEAEIVMRRRWPGDGDGPNGKGATYSFKLSRQWLGDGEEARQERARAMEGQAIEFLKAWKP
jgi:hypothetical protein